LPTFLLAFAVGPWDVVRGPDIAPGGMHRDPIPLRGIAPQGQGARQAYSLAHTPAIMRALEDYFDVPYPYPKLDNLAVPDKPGAMENAGLITYRDTIMYADERAPVRERQWFWEISAHELAHQWFGNLVTMPWWNDTWLKEAFAQWMGVKISDRLQPAYHAERGLQEGAIRAMAGDSLASTRRIAEPIADFTDIASAFDGITYQKGGAVLTMFERFLGEDRFRDGVRAYLRRHAGGSATADDLIGAIAAQTGDPAATAAAFRSFLDQPGVPQVQVALDCSAGRPALQVQQRRYLPLGAAATPAQTWGLPLCVRHADGDAVRTQCDLVVAPMARIELRHASACPAWVMPNAHGAGYYRFALTPPLQRALAAAFPRLDEREQRAYADSLSAAFHAGQLAPADYLAALPVLAEATARQTVTAPFPDLDWMLHHLADGDAERVRLRAQLAAVYRPRLERLGFAARANEDDEARLLRGSLISFFALTLRDAAVRAELARQGRAALGLDGDGRLQPRAVPAEWRAVALSVAVQEGGQAAFDAAERYLRSSDDTTLRNDLLAALGASPDPALAARVRALTLEPDTVRPNELGAVFDSQLNQDPAGRVALRDWLDRHFDALARKVAPNGARVFRRRAAHLCGAGEAAALERRFAQRLAQLDGGPRALKEAVERAQLCGALRAAQRAHGFGAAVQ
jgi:alanyl aminopeptidase